MGKKRKVYSSVFKSKLILEVLKNEPSMSEIVNTHNITAKNSQNRKKTFLENTKIAMEPSKAVKEYKLEQEISTKLRPIYPKI